MIKININNGQQIRLIQKQEDSHIIFERLDNKGKVNYGNTITAGEMVMLLNYFQNYKDEIEESDYIK